jgi:ribulose-phosphate 3-epimerase
MKLAPSLLSADFSALYEEAMSVAPLADRYHWDVMDGHFVPNLTFGPPVVNALRSRLRAPFDVHLMIDHPATYVPAFNILPGDTLIFHADAKDPPEEVLKAIASAGARAGITLRPKTPLETVAAYFDQVELILVMSVEPGFGGQSFLPGSADRIAELKRRIGGRRVEIAVDGGIHAGNVRQVVDAGAEVIVAGSAIFGVHDRRAAMRALQEAAGERL